MAYVEKTTVPVSKSRIEIKELIRKHGARQFISGHSGNKVMIGFTAENRQIRFIIEIPEGKTDKQQEQVERQRWRALLLVIKAKFEAIESGVSCFDNEFMAHIVLPDGQTISEYMLPQIESAYQSGAMPALLPMIGE